MQLNFYPFGVILHRSTKDGGVDYAVDPEHIAKALAAKMQFETGLINPNTLYIALSGLRHTVAEFRPPQKTALFLEGSAEPLRVPLPGLIMIRHLIGGETVKYAVFAVDTKERPASLDIPLFEPPLPNIYHAGNVCWGNVPRVSAESLAGTDLTEDWSRLLGSTFTPHSVSGKSRSQPQDIRHMLLALEARHARVYPRRDLVRHHLTLAHALTEIRRSY